MVIVIDDLIKAVHELSKGRISEATEHLLMRLQRPLPPGDLPIKLFALNFDVEKCNSDCLLDMPGKAVSYTSVDCFDVAKDKQLLDTTMAPETLFLKIDAPVVLIVNLSDTLVNGTRGKVTSLSPTHVSVRFQDNESDTVLSQYTFSVYDPHLLKNVATRKQIPLKLAFAFTVHKSQGMTIQRLEIDCRNMNTPGQIGVAVGRAVSKKGLRVLNFNKKRLLPQPSMVEDFYSMPSTPLADDLSCCKFEFVETGTVNLYQMLPSTFSCS